MHLAHLEYLLCFNFYFHIWLKDGLLNGLFHSYNIVHVHMWDAVF